MVTMIIVCLFTVLLIHSVNCQILTAKHPCARNRTCERAAYRYELPRRDENEEFDNIHGISYKDVQNGAGRKFLGKKEDLHNAFEREHADEKHLGNVLTETKHKRGPPPIMHKDIEPKKKLALKRDLVNTDCKCGPNCHCSKSCPCKKDHQSCGCKKGCQCNKKHVDEDDDNDSSKDDDDFDKDADDFKDDMFDIDDVNDSQKLEEDDRNAKNHDDEFRNLEPENAGEQNSIEPKTNREFGSENEERLDQNLNQEVNRIDDQNMNQNEESFNNQNDESFNNQNDESFNNQNEESFDNQNSNEPENKDEQAEMRKLKTGKDKEGMKKDKDTEKGPNPYNYKRLVKRRDSYRIDSQFSQDQMEQTLMRNAQEKKSSPPSDDNSCPIGKVCGKDSNPKDLNFHEKILESVDYTIQHNSGEYQTEASKQKKRYARSHLVGLLFKDDN